jgi:hypothetical protein
MTDKKLYLRPNVVAEPLFNQWYAWPSLIPPTTAAMYVANSHLKIMQSFIYAPQIHVTALKNPAMRGGPFINCDASRVPEIKALMERTIKEQAALLELAKAIEALNKKPKQVYVYAMGQEPWLTYLTSIQYTDQSRPVLDSNKLVEDCRSHHIESERLYRQKELYL